MKRFNRESLHNTPARIWKDSTTGERKFLQKPGYTGMPFQEMVSEDAMTKAIFLPNDKGDIFTRSLVNFIEDEYCPPGFLYRRP